MSAILLDGKSLSSKIFHHLKGQVRKILQQTQKPPGLAVIQVGEDEASKIYVSRKTRFCQEVGIFSLPLHLPVNTSERELIQKIQTFNEDPRLHGILVQLPLPKNFSTEKVLETIHYTKDVDGFHAQNVGKLLLGHETMVPCTPQGILRLLDEYQVPMEGSEAVVVGRSNIVGKPVAQLLLNRNCTVTLCHSKTRGLDQVCRRADILVAAIGKPEIIRGSWVKEGAAVVDVGVNRKQDGRVVGDVCFEEVSKKARWITPVPGGVGPMTIAMLLSNTVKAAEKQMGRV